MSFLREFRACALLLLLATCQTACVLGPAVPSRSIRLFATHPPQNTDFQQELSYLLERGMLLPPEKEFIDSETARAEQEIGVPQALLWCVLFQESRFDPLKNADKRWTARGMGQFTSSALKELNRDTNHYDSKTRRFLLSVLGRRGIPLTFSLSFRPRARKAPGRWNRLPARVPGNSYFHQRAAISATGAYLNNRYWQLRHALDYQGLDYDPSVLWLYAAAAYNKGARTVFTLLNQQRLTGGKASLRAALTDPKVAFALLTERDRLEGALSDLWPNRTRARKVEELSRNIEFIASCFAHPGEVY